MTNMETEQNKCDQCAGTDLSDYITKINTDIGKSFNKELFLNKIAKVSRKEKFGFGKSKRECRMASATNPLGISSGEYGEFAIHVYRYLSYIKGLEIPSFEELKDNGKIVNIDSVKDNKRLLVFDLDETLVHCIFNDKDTKEADIFLDIQLPNGKTANAGFNIRPYWKEMMDEIKDDWEVVVFTASCQNYADTIIDYLDPEGVYFPHRFYRESCWLTPEGVYIKDLRVFHQWDLKDIILVDNAVYSFGFQLDNGIPIFPYIKGKDDKQLLYLKEYLKSISRKEIIPDLQKTFQMSSLYSCDIESFLDYYEDDEDSDENADDILDQMFNNEINRKKAMSFQSMPFMHKNRSYTENSLNITEKEYICYESLAINSDEIPRSFSGNVEEVRHQSELTDSHTFDSEHNSYGQDSGNSDSKHKIKKKRVKYGTMKKVKSECTPLLSNDKYKKLDECDLPKISTLDEEVEDKLSRDNCTPLQAKPAKRQKKRKRLNKMKELKLGVSCEYDINEDQMNYDYYNYSHFSKTKSKEDMDESNSSNSQKDDETNDYRIGPFSTGGINYVFKRENNLSRSAKVKEKRSPSPLNRDVSHSFKNSLNVQLNKRKSSTSSSSNCDDEFERDDESGKLTNCTSKNQYSHISSTELEKCNGYCVSPFDNVIEADSDKESSPLPSRINDRKNSLMDDLDILSKCLPTVNLMRANSGVVENIENSKANKSKLRLRHCEIVECHKEDY